MSPDDHAHDNSHGHPHASIEDAPLGYYARMQEAVQELLIESGVLTADEIRRAVEAMDERSPAQGARVVARAWTDPAFKARLLADGTAACRSRAVREPRTVLREFGTEIPADVEVRIHDSTADMRYLVLPQRPEGTDALDEAALSGLVTRDAMIGVTLPAAR